MMPLDPLGTIILTLPVVVLFLLVLGLPLVRGINTKKNLKRHVILATFALALQTVFVLVIMVPSFANNFVHILALSSFYAVNTRFHVILGSIAIVSGFAYTGLWLAYFSSGMRCARAKKIHDANLNDLGSRDNYRWLNPLVTDVLTFAL